MNPVEIEAAVAELAEAPFDKEEFPFSLLAAFDNKETTIKRLRTGNTNRSDIGGVLQRSYIHILACDPGEVSQGFAKLLDSPETTKAKARFVLATDGIDLEAEDLKSGETIACPFKDMPEKFGFFLPLADFETIREIRESAFDIKATGRLNKLYLELLKLNPDWGKDGRREEMNHFLARLIFCFFAEDTEIFQKENMFTKTLENMSAQDGSDLHERIGDLFHAMNTKPSERDTSNVQSWAKAFPYVNGALFEDTIEVPRFNRATRTMLAHIGMLDWKKINPDIFGSMIQAVANEEERSSIGLHYTSVSNILKVLRPLFLDDLRKQLVEAGTSTRKLLNLRKRLSRIRVFDPACGSGNFLVIAYKAMREVEYEANKQRGEEDEQSHIPITNFRGIEIHSFPAEIARLALIIAEYQCNVRYRGVQAAVDDLLPLSRENWITCGNALQINWLDICPSAGRKVAYRSRDVMANPGDQTEKGFENEGGETYICGNPPYLGSARQTPEHKKDMKGVFEHRDVNWKSLDYVAGWFMKASEYGCHANAVTAFVSTNSICQGQAVSMLWPAIHATGHQIDFAYKSFVWSNLARYNAGVTVVIVGIAKAVSGDKRLFFTKDDGTVQVRLVENISAYLEATPNVIVRKRSHPFRDLPEMVRRNIPANGDNLLLSASEAQKLHLTVEQRRRFIRRFYGSDEYVKGNVRYFLWIEEEHLEEAMSIDGIRERVEAIRRGYSMGRSKIPVELAIPQQHLKGLSVSGKQAIIIPRVSSENRLYLPVGIVDSDSVIGEAAIAIYDAPTWCMALIASRLHLVWIATVCGKLKTDFRYSNTMGWNTFPVPYLASNNKDRLTECAEAIQLTREGHFPATIAELYDPKRMPENLRAAHDWNDEVVERIYVGRRFRNDSDRLEHLLKMYTEMVSTNGGADVPLG